MKLELTNDLVPKMTLEAFPEPGAPSRQWRPAAGPNYLVYDSHRKAPTGFAIRVGKKASVYLVEKLIAGKNMKIHVGLARGKKGDEQVIDLDTARDRAREMFPRVYFNELRTERLVECLKRYRWNINSKTGQAVAPLHDEFSHGADAFRYLSLVEGEMSNGIKQKPIEYKRKYLA